MVSETKYNIYYRFLSQGSKEKPSTIDIKRSWYSNDHRAPNGKEVRGDLGVYRKRSKNLTR